MSESNSSPSWYWNKGLHDAEITHIDEIVLPYDYTQKNPIRNCLIIFLNSKNALFDTSVKEIRLYNYKLISPDNKSFCADSWWIADRLTEENGKYILTVSLQNAGSLIKKFNLTVRFEKADVIRN